QGSAAHTASLGRQNSGYQRVGIEDHEELPGSAPDGPYQRRIYPGQRLPAFQRLPTHREEVHHFVYREAEDFFPAVHLEEHRDTRPSGSLGWGRGLAEGPPPFHHRDERAPYVHQARHHGRRARDPRGREPGEY